MTLKECYKILQIEKSASLDEIKHAYRIRAFQLHPDLNPNLTDASQRFQKLNEAYVILSKIVAEREKQTSSATSGKTSTETTSENNRPQEEKKQEDKKTEQKPKDSAESSKNKAGEEVYAEQQRVIHDILKDAFARRVFEDIYREIHNKKSTGTANNNKEPSPKSDKPDTPAKTQYSVLKRLKQAFGEQHPLNFHFSKNLGESIRNWMRSQIDEEQSITLPARHLTPGSKLRLQIRHGLSEELTTLEVTIPPDFRPESPIRLKGMGKKLGHWQGDLYLYLSTK